jgi:hypothetical protein
MTDQEKQKLRATYTVLSQDLKDAAVRAHETYNREVEARCALEPVARALFFADAATYLKLDRLRWEAEDVLGNVYRAHGSRGDIDACRDGLVELFQPGRFGWHDSLEIDDDVALRHDDGVIRLVFSENDRARELREAWGVVTPIAQIRGELERAQKDVERAQARVTQLNERLEKAEKRAGVTP